MNDDSLFHKLIDKILYYSDQIIASEKALSDSKDTFIWELSILVFAYRPDCGTKGGSIRCLTSYLDANSFLLSSTDRFGLQIFANNMEHEVVFGGTLLIQFLEAIARKDIPIKIENEKAIAIIEQVADRIRHIVVEAESLNKPVIE